MKKITLFCVLLGIMLMSAKANYYRSYTFLDTPVTVNASATATIGSGLEDNGYTQI